MYSQFITERSFFLAFVDYKSDQMIGGQISHDIIRLSVTKDGLVGGLVNTLFGVVNDAVCTVLGPNFLKLLLDECKSCPEFARSQNNIESHEEFCELYNLLPADAQECVTDGAIRIKGPSIFRIDYVIGQCCAKCAKAREFNESFLIQLVRY